ncbi:hypothetical protein IV203_013885 [Nitzschia inconspicua]|uniref:Uncharacterized protein n=1 Tax=Nitzschia inconspicua TaxID=303405 RepID=A0A9K3M7M4_9STRA|nr:hypothetical protein IV203_013885 [Nitzschia inconspicua]
MGNDASKKNKSSSSSEQTITDTITTNDILNDKFSDFEDISHPSSPETNNSLEKKQQKTDNAVTVGNNSDEMSYSGILVEKTGSMMIMSDHTTNVTVSSTNTSAFSAPPTTGTPKSGDNSDNINTTSSTVKPNPNRRRIIKATPPPSAAATTVLAANKVVKDADDDDDSIVHHGGKQHLPAVLSSKASSELLQESIEQSKSKRLEKLSRDQKSKREKLLDAKRRGLKTGSDNGNSNEEESSKKKKPQPNPFSRFLRVFSVEPEYPHHKRAYEESEIDREVVDTVDTNKTVTATATTTTPTTTIATSGRHSPSVVIAAHNDSKRQKLSDESHDTKNTFSQKGKVFLSSLVEKMPEWVPLATASAAMAAVAVMVALKLNAITSGANTKS